MINIIFDSTYINYTYKITLIYVFLFILSFFWSFSKHFHEYLIIFIPPIFFKKYSLIFYRYFFKIQIPIYLYLSIFQTSLRTKLPFFYLWSCCLSLTTIFHLYNLYLVNNKMFLTYNFFMELSMSLLRFLRWLRWIPKDILAFMLVLIPNIWKLK